MPETPPRCVPGTWPSLIFSCGAGPEDGRENGNTEGKLGLHEVGSESSACFGLYRVDAEGLGRKLLLTPPPAASNPQETPEKQAVRTVTASHTMLTLQALSSSLTAGTAKRGCLGQGLWHFPPNGRVHYRRCT